MGAHAIYNTDNGEWYIVNSTGSYLTIAFAATFHIPVYIIADEAKIARLRPGEALPSLNAATTLLRPIEVNIAGHDVRSFNPLNEMIRWSHQVPFTIITEKATYLAQPHSS